MQKRIIYKVCSITFINNIEADYTGHTKTTNTKHIQGE